MDHQLVDHELDNLTRTMRAIRDQTCKEPMSA